MDSCAKLAGCVNREWPGTIESMGAWASVPREKEDVKTEDSAHSIQRVGGKGEELRN